MASVFVIGRGLEDTPSLLPITKTAAVFGVLDVLLRLSLGVPGFSSTVRKLLYWELVPIALNVVKYYGYSLRGINLTPVRPLETFSDQEKRSSKQSYETTFLRHYFAESLDTFGRKKCNLKHMVHFFNAQRVGLGCN